MKKRIHDATIVQHALVLLGAPLVLHKLEGRPEPSRTESEGGTKMGGGVEGGGKALGYHHLSLLII